VHGDDGYLRLFCLSFFVDLVLQDQLLSVIIWRVSVIAEIVELRRRRRPSRLGILQELLVQSVLINDYLI